MVGVSMKMFNSGAIWLKGDLHLHSPFVNSFNLPSGMNLNNDNILINEYIAKLKENKINFAAITDYQQIRTNWFKNLQHEASKENVVIFPGIELSVTYGRGLHILLIFEKDTDINGINDYIKSLDKNPQNAFINSDRTHRDIELQKNLKDVLEEVKQKFNCLIIFPHPKDKNGVLDVFQPKEAAELLKYVDASEMIDEQDENKLISTGIINKSFFENFPIIENSDPKNIDDIGTKKRVNKIRTTYYKLSEISINALKIAFQEPKFRISVYEKPEYEFDRIERIKIEGSRFLKNIELNFNKELNCFIGGRGVGKSAIIESIRYCLKTPYYSEQTFREDFVNNVIGSGGKITLELNQLIGDTNKKYIVERIIGKEPEVVDFQSSPVDILGDNIPVIIGQKELYHLANDKNYLLQLVDQLIGKEIKNKEYQFKEKLQLLDDNARRYLNIIEKLKNKDNDEQRLRTLEDNLKVFIELGVVDKMEEATNLIKDENLLQTKLTEVDEKFNNLKSAYEELINTLQISSETLLNGTSKVKNYLIEISKELKEILKNLQKTQVIEVIKTFNKKDKLKRWYELKSKYDDEINQIKQELSKRNIQVEKYEAYVKERENLTKKISEYEKLETELKKLKEERENLKNQVSEIRHKLFNIRKSKLEELNKKLEGKIKIIVEYESNRDNFSNKLRNLLRGSTVQSSAIDSIINNDKISLDGIELSKIIEKGKGELKQKFNLTDAITNRIYEWFKDVQKLFELEKLFPEDKISIELKVDNEYKEFEKLSAGQKATALLILLFMDEQRILIIDQPEEDLDNRFIYEDVVKFLLSLKRKRQLIFATHNANIPVLGDAEQVFVLESDSRKGCIIKDNGSIDSQLIVEHIKSIMEGGEEAFNKRIQKYGKNKI